MTASEAEQLPAVAFALKEKAMDEAPVGITISDISLPDNPLVYVNDAFVRTTGYSEEFALGRNCRFLQGEDTDEEKVARMARAIEEHEPVTVEVRNYTKSGEEFWNEVTIAPLRNEMGEVTHFVGFQADVTDRKQAEMTVEQERKNLAHLLDRINGLLEGVTSELVKGVNRTEIEEAVCACITKTTPYTTAWIGETDMTGDRLEPATTAGDMHQLVPESPIEMDDAGELAAAMESETLCVLDDNRVLPDSRRSTGEVAVVPLKYGDRKYGALFIHAAATGSFNDREAAVLESLGRMVATALDAHESKRIISTNNVVEMELLVRDREFFFVDLATRSGSTIEYAGSVYREGSPNTFVTTDGDPGSVVDLVGDAPEIDKASIVGTEAGSALIELQVTTESIVSKLAEQGAKTNTITATGEEAHLEIELPAGADARSIVQQIKDQHPQTELRRYQERERPPTTKHEFIADLEDRLTDQQFTALQRAYVGGYYDWDRGTNGDELAKSMGVSRPTFHQHLRAAERKLVEEFFEG